MPTTYITKQNEILDAICYRHYGSTINRQVEIVLDANPGLEQQGIVLDMGLVIILPDIVVPAVSVRKTVKLWE